MNSNFGAFLKEKRQEKNLTQKQLSKLLYVSESAISKWEKNVAHPDISLLPKLSKILGVSEHELITASVDEQMRTEKRQAKKWRTLSFTWSLFFYISYALTLIPCFICNLAIDKTLSWFWIVLCSLILSFTFTNLPKLIKKYKLIFIPLSQFLALTLLLGVIALYSNGKWFWIAILSIFLGILMIFAPIYISKYNLFNKIKKYNDFVSIAICFIFLNILLVVIENYTINEYSIGGWYFSLALPISLSFYLFLNLLLSVRFLKLNKLLNAGIVLFLIDLLYLIPPFIKVENPSMQSELNDTNIFNANFSRWIGSTIEQNVHLIIFLTTLLLSIVFLFFGLIKHYKRTYKS